MNAPGSHAGLMALLEDTLAGAARERAGEGRVAVAIDLQFAFVAPAQGPLAATARVVGGGRSLCFCEGEAVDADGSVVARAMGTFRAQATA
jgi:acyl-coenzyme A thioesterase PaaI-like protein